MSNSLLVALGLLAATIIAALPVFAGDLFGGGHGGPGARNVPELSANAAGSAAALVAGGLLVMTGRRRNGRKG